LLLGGQVFETTAQDRPAISLKSISEKSSSKGDSSKKSKLGDKSDSEGATKAESPGESIGKILP
jgi:hypothetical protein